MTRYAIGDVQGCFASLEKLLAKIAFDPARDELWLTGDLVNRGPRNVDVLRWARRTPAVTTVLGNHDLHLLARAAGVAKEKKKDTLDDVLGAPDRAELIEWLRQRPVLVADERFLMVHAGLHPRWTADEAMALAKEIEAQIRGPGWKQFLASTLGGAPPWSASLGGLERARAALAYFVRVRQCFLDGRMDPTFDGNPKDAKPGTAPWFALPDRLWTSHTAIFGHWAALGLDLGTNHAGLDTGCVWGRELTALRTEDRVAFAVHAIERTAI